jgi:hypothetical protein
VYCDIAVSLKGFNGMSRSERHTPSVAKCSTARFYVPKTVNIKFSGVTLHSIVYIIVVVIEFALCVCVCSVSYTVCVVLCAVFCLSLVCYFM